MRLIDVDAINPMRCPRSIAEMREWLDEQPTAYDVDKVVEKLKERASQSCAVLFAAGIEEAISIIKAGEQND